MNIQNTSIHLIRIPAALLMTIASLSGSYAATPVVEMSRTVETLCPQLKRDFTNNPGSLTAVEQDVLFRCGELKLTPGQTFSDFSGDQLNGLDYMTSDESSIMGTSSVELSGAQNVAVLGRLTILRGKSTGSVASNLPSTPTGGDEQKSSFTSTHNSDSAYYANNADMESLGVLNGYDGSFSQMSDYGKWGFFLNGSYGTGDKDRTSNEPGFDFDSWGLVSGVDYRLSDQIIMGVALSYASTESEVDRDGGDVDLDGFGAVFYGTYYLGDFYLDALAGFSAKDYDTSRHVWYSVPAKAGGTTMVDQTFDSNPDGTDINLSLGSGYNINLGGFGITPYAQLAYVRSDIDGYTESLQGTNNAPGFGLGLSVDDQDITSFASTVGFQFAKAINTSKGVISPYLRVDWEHEFENDARNITARFAGVGGGYSAANTIIIPTDDPDRDFFNVGAGASMVLAGGYQLFLDYSTVLEYEDISLHTVVAGLRLEF